MAGVPSVVPDMVGPIVKPGEPQVYYFPILTTTPTGVLFRGQLPTLLPGLTLAGRGGPWNVSGATLFSTKVRVRGLPVVMVGAVLTPIADGWSGPVTGPGAVGLLIG